MRVVLTRSDHNSHKGVEVVRCEPEVFAEPMKAEQLGEDGGVLFE